MSAADDAHRLVSRLRNSISQLYQKQSTFVWNNKPIPKSLEKEIRAAEEAYRLAKKEMIRLDALPIPLPKTKKKLPDVKPTHAQVVAYAKTLSTPDLYHGHFNPGGFGDS